MAIYSAWALFVGVALLMLGVGLQGSLLGLRATTEGFDVFTIGLVMSAYYGGFIAGSWGTSELVRQVGHIRVFAALASLTSTTILLHATFVNPAAWLVIRFVAGFSVAGLFVIAESWLNHTATNQTRGKILSIYTIITYAAMALGQLLLNLADPNGFILFIVVSVLVSISLIPISLTTQAAPPIDRPRAISLVDLYRASPLGLTGCFATGVGQGALFSLAAVYAVLRGFDISSTSLFLALPLVGVVLSQYPIGALSDRFDRRQVLMALSILIALAALANGLMADLPLLWQMVAITGLGALALPLYSLAISHMNDNIESDQMLGASAKLVLVYGIGSALGPMAVSLVMVAVGARGFFWSLAAVYLALGLFALFRMTQSKPVPLEEQGDFVLVGTRPSPVVANVAMEIGEEGGETPDAPDFADTA
ncbi:MAG: MFS transporter [Hyphomicrobiales bacterium]